jgi:hypothetical protein
MALFGINCPIEFGLAVAVVLMHVRSYWIPVDHGGRYLYWTNLVFLGCLPSVRDLLSFPSKTLAATRIQKKRKTHRARQTDVTAKNT